jgi:hypothetical protein
VNWSLVVVSFVAGGLVLAGCGSGADNPTPPVTINGVGVRLSGPRPEPITPTACAHRWNEAANTSERVAATNRAPNANGALVQTAGRGGYFEHEAGRCLVWLITRPSRAVVFVETAPGRFSFIANAAAGHFAANANVQRDGRLRLR